MTIATNRDCATPIEARSTTAYTAIARRTAWRARRVRAPILAMLAGGLMLSLLAMPVPFGPVGCDAPRTNGFAPSSPAPHASGFASWGISRASAQASNARSAPPASAPADAPHATPHAPVVVQINTATLAELDSLPGIGPSKAEAIIAARGRRPFRRLHDLLRVPGIGRATLARLAPLVAFDLPPPPPTSAPADREAANANRPRVSAGRAMAQGTERE